jgi:hypothetical protein
MSIATETIMAHLSTFIFLSLEPRAAKGRAMLGGETLAASG